jgi:hypothetical protein
MEVSFGKKMLKITLFLGIWLFIVGFSFNIGGNLDHFEVINYETFFLKITYPVLLFLFGSIIFKYFQTLTTPLLFITIITCFFLMGKEYSNMIYLLPFYLVMYLGGYFGADWYRKNIQIDA